MTKLATADIPAGLVLAPSTATPRTWELHHRESGMPVVKDCPTRDAALRAALALGGVTWDRDVDAIRADPLARAVYIAVQTEVLAEAHTHGRRS